MTRLLLNTIAVPGSEQGTRHARCGTHARVSARALTRAAAVATAGCPPCTLVHGLQAPTGRVGGGAQRMPAFPICEAATLCAIHPVTYELNRGVQTRTEGAQVG
jgi:hypothetical protein